MFKKKIDGCKYNPENSSTAKVIVISNQKNQEKRFVHP